MDIINNTDEYYMKEALKEAEKAMMRDEIPVGAVIVYKNQIIGRAHNLTETLNDVTAHAEMQAFTAAANTMGSKYLTECTLYVTLEPCIMCAGACFWTQIGRMVYGAADKERGFTRIRKKILHPKTQVMAGVLEQECSNILTAFFRKKR
ncbi:MAG: nucleoside deaminase [Bacteroidales bacterium]|nr:nucleoside deaminase [Bacteroidales bacterium]